MVYAWPLSKRYGPSPKTANASGASCKVTASTDGRCGSSTTRNSWTAGAARCVHRPWTGRTSNGKNTKGKAGSKDDLLRVLVIVVVPGRQAPETQNPSAHRSCLRDRHTPVTHST